jgi:hypothetical protein
MSRFTDKVYPQSQIEVGKEGVFFKIKFSTNVRILSNCKWHKVLVQYEYLVPKISGNNLTRVSEVFHNYCSKVKHLYQVSEDELDDDQNTNESLELKRLIDDQVLFPLKP